MKIARIKTLALRAAGPLLCAVLLAAGTVLAHGPDGRGARRPGGPLIGILFSPELELTEDQRGAIKDMLDGAKATHESDLAAMKTAEDAMFTYLKGGGNDTAQIQTLAAAIGTAVTTVKDNEAALFADAYLVLTDEQKAVLATLSAPAAAPSGSRSAARSKRGKG